MTTLLAKPICLVFGHNYMVAQEFTSDARRVVCRDCRGDWAMCDSVRAFVPWDESFEDLYQRLGYVVHNPWMLP